MHRVACVTSVGNVYVLPGVLRCKMAPLMGLPLPFPVKYDMVFLVPHNLYHAVFFLLTLDSNKLYII